MASLAATTIIDNIVYQNVAGHQLVPLKDFLSTTLFSRNTQYYFEPSTNSIFSTATGPLRKLNGTRGTSRTDKGDTVWTFLGKRFTLTEIVMAFSNFARGRSKNFGKIPVTGVATAKTALPSAVTSQPTDITGLITKGNVIIGTVSEGNTISFSKSPAIHTTQYSWTAEIERLAKAHPGQRFIAVAVVGSVVSGGLVWN